MGFVVLGGKSIYFILFEMSVGAIAELEHAFPCLPNHWQFVLCLFERQVYQFICCSTCAPGRKIVFAQKPDQQN
jgi:hypothetical protein